MVAVAPPQAPVGAALAAFLILPDEQFVEGVRVKAVAQDPCE